MHASHADFTDAFAHGWANDPDELAGLFAKDGVYANVATGDTARGRGAIARYQAHMLAFAPDSSIEVHTSLRGVGHLTMEWTWTGTATGPLRLPSGQLVDATGNRFSLRGVAVCTHGGKGLLTRQNGYWDLYGLLAQVAPQTAEQADTDTA